MIKSYSSKASTK